MPDPSFRPPDDQDPRGRGVSGILIVVILVLLGIIALYFLMQRYPGALVSPDDQISLVYLGLLGGAVLFSALGLRRLDQTALTRYLQYAALWAIVFVVLAGGYSYRFEMQRMGQRILGGLVPGYGGATDVNEVTYARAADGHFYIDATSIGSPIRFLVDTGASGIVLTPADARRMGYEPVDEDFSQYFQTANGTVRGAPVVLEELRIGDRFFYNLWASINEAPMSDSLLGMAFLRELESFEVRGDRLILRWHPEADQ
jgi:aspartyl protease family protein